MTNHLVSKLCRFAVFTVTLLVTFSMFTGCQSSPPGAQAPQAVFPTTPLTKDTATITANGLSCPLCANNIDATLKKLPGVQTVDIDLSTGRITVGLFGKIKPSKASLATAITDAGFTVVSVE